MKSGFFIKIHVKVFYVQTWFKCETSFLLSLYTKKVFPL